MLTLRDFIIVTLILFLKLFTIVLYMYNILYLLLYIFTTIFIQIIEFTICFSHFILSATVIQIRIETSL